MYIKYNLDIIDTKVVIKLLFNNNLNKHNEKYFR